MTEIWLPVKGWEGIYEVSSFGRVRSLDHYVKGKGGTLRLVKGRILKPQIASGYLQVYFYENGKQKWYKVHTLVAEAFLPVPQYLFMEIENGDAARLEINHKNEVKTDNRAENLEWCTSKYNANWGTAIARARKRNEERLGRPVMTEEERKIHISEYKKEWYAKNKETIKKKNLERYYKKKGSQLFI